MVGAIVRDAIWVDGITVAGVLAATPAVFPVSAAGVGIPDSAHASKSSEANIMIQRPRGAVIIEMIVR